MPAWPMAFFTITFHSFSDRTFRCQSFRDGLGGLIGTVGLHYVGASNQTGVVIDVGALVLIGFVSLIAIDTTSRTL